MASDSAKYLLQRLKELKYPYLSDADTPGGLEAMFFEKSEARLIMMQWLYGKLGVVLERNSDSDYESLLDTTIKNGFCLKKCGSDLIMGTASLEKQTSFLSSLLDLAYDLNLDKRKDTSTTGVTGNDLREKLKFFNSDIKLDVPVDLQMKLDRTEKLPEITKETWKQKIKLLEDELEEKQTKLKALPDITLPTVEQYSRLRRVSTDLEEISTKFIKVYDEQMKVWCKSDGTSETDATQLSLGGLSESLNKHLDKLSRLSSGIADMEKFFLKDIPELHRRNAQIKEKLNSDLLNASLGPNNIDKIDKLASIFDEFANEIERHAKN